MFSIDFYVIKTFKSVFQMILQKMKWYSNYLKSSNTDFQFD